MRSALAEGSTIAASTAAAAVLLLAVAPVVGAGEAAAQQAFIDKYCSSCHNSNDGAGSMDLGSYSTGKMGADAAVWEKVSRKVRGGMMPPADRQAAARRRRPRPLPLRSSRPLTSYDKTHFRLPPSTLGAAQPRRVRQRHPRHPGPGSRRGHACCRRMIRARASTTSPTCWWSRPALVESYVSAAMRISRERGGRPRHGAGAGIHAATPASTDGCRWAPAAE